MFDIIYTVFKVHVTLIAHFDLELDPTQSLSKLHLAGGYNMG